MTQKAGINNVPLRNHSGAKTMIQTLSENDIPLTHIAQLSGHINLKSIENYRKVSTKQQTKMSQVLSSVVAGTATKTSSYEKANPAIPPSTCVLLNHSNLWLCSAGLSFKRAIFQST